MNLYWINMMKTIKNEVPLVGVCNDMRVLQAAGLGWSAGSDLELWIGQHRVEGGKEYPVSHSHGFDDRDDVAAGLQGRLWLFDSRDHGQTVCWNHRGPAFSYGGEVDEYRRVVKSMDKVSKRLSAMFEQRGGCVDGVEEMGRWLEACGVTQIMFKVSRLTHGENLRFLQAGEWRTEATGVWLGRVRRVCLPVAKVEQVTGTELAIA